MPSIIKTKFGDEWIVDGDIATSKNTKRWYGMSDDLKYILENASTNEVMANRLRKIDIAPISPEGENFLIPDPKEPGWSRPISFKNPNLKWEAEEGYRDTVLVKTSDPSVAWINRVGEIGNYMGDHCVFKFDAIGKFWGEVARFNTRDEALQLIDSGSVPDPLPRLDGQESAIIPLMNNLHAEIRTEVNEVMGRFVHDTEIVVLDAQNKAVCHLRTDPQTIIEMRDNRQFLERMVDEYGESDNTVEIPKAPLLEFETEEELTSTLKELKEGDPVRFRSADRLFEVSLAWNTISTLRTSEGKKIYSGTDMLPALELLEDYKLDKVILSKEKGYDLTIKKSDGYFEQKLPSMAIDPQKLFSFATDPKMMLIQVDSTKERLSKQDTRFTPTQIVAASIQGSVEHVEFIKKSEVRVKDMVKRIESDYRRSEEKFLDMGMR